MKSKGNEHPNVRLTLTCVCLLAERRLPWQIVVKILAFFAVQSFGIVRALAASVHHVNLVLDSLQRQTVRRVAIAGARSANHHIRNGIVVFFLRTQTLDSNRFAARATMAPQIYLNFFAIVEQGVTEIVQFREIDSQIGHFQHVLNVLGVRVLDGDIWRQHPENDFAILRWRNVRIALIAHHVRHIFRNTRRKRERFFAIVCKVTVHVPRPTEIIRSLDQHGGRSKRSEHNDQMREMEFGFQVQLNGDIFLAIFRLPP